MLSLLNRRKPRLLIVDDEQVNIDVLRRVLSGAGLGHIASTTDPTTAVSLYLSETPDLVILDLHMPVMDGFHVLTALKEAIPAESFPNALTFSRCS